MNGTMMAGMASTTRIIEVHARRWFQKSYGNTYHSVRVVVDGRVVGVRSGVYGYGDHYMHTAGEILRDADCLPWVGQGEDPQRTPYDWTIPFDWSRGVRSLNWHGEDWVLVETCEDVARRRDLLPSWWTVEGFEDAAEDDEDDEDEGFYVPCVVCGRTVDHVAAGEPAVHVECEA